MDSSGHLTESIDVQMPSDDYSRFKDEISMLKDKVAHLQNQLEESEHETIMAAEIGQQLLEQKSSLETLREQERNTYTAKLEDLIQENFNLTAKLESREKMLEIHSQYDDEDKRKKQEQEKEQMILLYDKKISDLKNDIKKAKMTHDEEVSQLNLIIQQNNEIIKNLQNEIVEEREKNLAAEFKLANDGEIEELKTAIEICHQAKRQVENKLCEMIHDNERRNLESENLRQRLKELNEELNEKTRQIEDCYQHLEDAKNTINELNLEVSSQQMELKSRGHSKKGNSLFGELEDKRVAAERNLAIFKVRYDSLRKAYNNAKHEMVQMRYQVLGFLQIRTGDNADRIRVEQLERALTAQRAESAMLSTKLKQLQQYEKDQNPANKVKECMESFQGNDSLKHYVNLLLINAEENKQSIETLQKELEFARFRLIAKDDQLHETERKLYTATYSADKFRNESIKVKLKVDEMKSKFEAEKEKRAELESLLNELGIIERSPTSAKDFSKIIEEKKLVLPRYLQPASSGKEDPKKSTVEEKAASKPPANDEALNKKLTKVDEEIEKTSVRPLEERNECVITEKEQPVLTEKELNEKCCRLLLNTLPTELAEEYIKEYQNGNNKKDVFNEDSLSWPRKNRGDKDGSKSRKVSFKDEVDVHEIDENNSCKANVVYGNSGKFLESDQMASNDAKESSHDPRTVIVDDQAQGDACKVQ